MENLSEKLKAEIIAYIKKNQPTVYWDYREKMSDENIEKILCKDGLNDVENELWEYNIDYICELETEAAKEYADEFEDRICEETGEAREVWEDDFEEWAKEHIGVDMDMKQLIRNTGDQIFFYDTGLEFDGWGRSAAEYRYDRMRIKKALSIAGSGFDSRIDMMLQQASYGGQLVVYFTSGINELLDISDEMNVINFSNAHIAIIDTCNGSGDNCHIPGHNFSLPFDRDNLKYERSISYNYSFDVCGMVSDWCDDTRFSFSHEDQAA
ncbi:MAG: hypothetical protein EOM73_12700, partial [Bacteroidia bacterium]|nr:hypothetical protein [Bacteroidia bacterium]